MEHHLHLNVNSVQMEYTAKWCITNVLHEEPSQLHALRNMHEENRMAKMVINQQDGQDGNQPGALGTDNARAAPLIFLA